MCRKFRLVFLLSAIILNGCVLSDKTEDEIIAAILSFDFGNSEDDIPNPTENSAGPVGSCDGSVCDPDRLRQIRASVCGYNAFGGEPFSIMDGALDPGIRHPIFDPIGDKDDQGRIILKGITAIDQSLCAAELDVETFTTQQKFMRKINKISKIGFGIDMDVFGVSGGLAFSNSRTSDEIKEFFSKEHGAISIAYMSCITAKIMVDYFDLPKFKAGFKRGVQFLAMASTQPASRQKYFFRRFMNEYGTHYITATEMGATIMETRFLTRKARYEFDEQTLNECTQFDAHLRYDQKFTVNSSVHWKKCKDFFEGRNSSRHDFIKKETYVTKGSPPPEDGDIKKWAKQSFTPMPLKLELSPISNLLSEDVLEGQGMKDIDVAALRGWFMPMLRNYCDIVGIDCRIRGGCGFSDNCKLNEDCQVIDPKTETYKCVVDGHWSEWSGWEKCSVKCGRGLQKRTRKCDNPPPAKGGSPCPGNSEESKECDAGSCEGKVLYNQCYWLDSNWGVSVTCNHQFVATGSCGSYDGQWCKGEPGRDEWYTQKLRCCRTSATIGTSCESRSSPTAAVQLTCPSGKVVTSQCSNGIYRDCWANGRWVYYGFDCCPMNDHKFDEKRCYWQFAQRGNIIQCAPNMVMTGRCGTGADGDYCPKRTTHGIRCCPFMKMQK